MKKINPFRPSSPINPGMFVGRYKEILRIEAALLQTNAGSPINFMLTGERGIGKTSLLEYCRDLARGELNIEECKVKFLVLSTDIDQSTSQADLIEKIELAFRRELGKTEPARKFLSETWSFIQRLQTSVLTVKSKDKSNSTEIILEEFAYSLAETVNRICDETKRDDAFNATFGGVLLLIDEADNASKDLNLGTFVKLLLERLQRNRCNKFMIGLAGLPDLRTKLLDSHPSSLRVFEEISLERLSRDDVYKIIDICIEKANSDNIIKTEVDPKGKIQLADLSEGYPHFIHQYGYSAFEKDSDNVIDEKDVLDAAFENRGALEQIGDRYYRNDFYNKIKQESYRQVLRIMTDKVDNWITKEEIRAKYHGKDQTLNNALKALRDRKIIISAEGERGKYRLQHKGFAFWIRIFTTARQDLVSN